MKTLPAQFFLSVFLLFVPFAWGGWTVEPSRAALGTFPANAPPAARFVIENHGETPLENVRVRTDCGCVGAEVRGSAVAPNGTLEIIVRIEPEGISGAFVHSVFVEAGEGFRRVSVAGESAPLLTLSPSPVRDLGNLPPEAPIHAEFTVSSERHVEFGPAASEGLEIKTVRLDEKNFLLVLDGRAPRTAGPFRLEAEAPVVSPDGWRPLRAALLGRVREEGCMSESKSEILEEKGVTGK